MKRIFYGLGLVFLVLPATAQQNFVSLTQAALQPSAAQALVLDADAPGAARLTAAAKGLNETRIVKIHPTADAAALQDVMTALAKMPVLDELVLEGNAMQVLPAGIAAVKKLRTLRIEGNTNLHYEDAFEKLSALPALRTLAINGAGLKTVPAGIAALQQVQSIDLDKNPGLDLFASVEVLKGLPALRSVKFELFGADGLPVNLNELAQVNELQLVLSDRSARNNATTRQPAEGPAYHDAFRVPRDNGGEFAVTLESPDGPVNQAEETRLLISMQGILKNKRKTSVASTNQGFRRSYKGVNSPVPALDIRQSAYSVDASTGGTITHPSGTQISIPANAFTDAAGQPVQGPVTVTYREFRDQLDILVSGIPMTYEAEGEKGIFESAGMFEINAAVGNQEVFMAPGKQVSLAFASVDSAPTFNFYQYDPLKGGWKEEQKAAESRIRNNKKEKTQKPFSDAWRLFYPAAAYGRDFPDTVHYAGRYGSDDYFYTKKVNDKKKDLNYSFRKVTIGKKTKSTQVKHLVYLKREFCRSKDSTCFSLGYRQSVHPELTSLSRVYFVLPGKISSGEFRKRYGRKAAFSDVRISTDGDNAVIELKNVNGLTTVAAAIVNLDEHHHMVPLSEKRLVDINKRYNKQYASRIRSFDRGVDISLRGYKRFQAHFFKDSVRLWTKLRPEMSPEEKQLSFRDWVNYCKKMRATQVVAAGSTNLEVIRDLAVNNFGLYNCDQVKNQGADVYVKAKFRDAANAAFVPVFTYIINKEKNSILYYDCNHMEKYSPEKFAYKKSAPNVLISVQDDGMLAYLDEDEFRLANENSNGITRNYQVHVVDPEEISLEQLKEKLNIVKK